jgi:hypothetical protein
VTTSSIVDLSCAADRAAAFAGATWCRAYLAAAFGLDVEHRAGARLLAVRDSFICACCFAGRQCDALPAIDEYELALANPEQLRVRGRLLQVARDRGAAALCGVLGRWRVPAATGVLLGGSTLHSLLGSQRRQVSWQRR